MDNQKQLGISLTRKRKTAPNKINVVKRSPMKISIKNTNRNKGLLVPLLNNLQEPIIANNNVKHSPKRKTHKIPICTPLNEKLSTLKNEDAIKFFLWLDSISVSHKVKPTLKDYYKLLWKKEKIDNYPCLSDEKKKFRLMLMKAVQVDYKTRNIRDIIRFFMRHYEEIVDRIDRCGLSADAYVNEMLVKWTNEGKPGKV